MELVSAWHSVVLLSIITEGVRGRFSGNRGKSPLIGKWLGMFEGLKKKMARGCKEVVSIRKSWKGGKSHIMEKTGQCVC